MTKKKKKRVKPQAATYTVKDIVDKVGVTLNYVYTRLRELEAEKHSSARRTKEGRWLLTKRDFERLCRRIRKRDNS